MIDEVKVFKRIKNVDIVFDVGARISDNRAISCDITDYLKVHPKAEYHLFEPNPSFFEELKRKVGKYPNVHLNGCALGEYATTSSYNEATQSIDGSVSWRGETNLKVSVIALDEYVEKHGIKKIDLLKMDTEGSELNILLGGWHAVSLCRYIQYETWTEPHNTFIGRVLSLDFRVWDIGLRNMMCVRKGEIKPQFPRGAIRQKWQ